MSEYTLHYWGIIGRNWPILILARYGGFQLNWNKNPDAGYYKEHSPFGQLPLLVGPDNLYLGQSMAIFRFIARKTGLAGDNDRDFATSELLIEEAVDINAALGKAFYGADRKAEMDKLFAESIPKHLAAVEKLATGETISGKVLAGDLAIFAVLDGLRRLQPDVLDNSPKLKAFHAKLSTDEKLTGLVNDPSIPMYFQRQ
eukprot:TRINITY_DN51_c0_g2_i14.p1 TRINITY_DN51_c0_g2~~TRINITY_DN51_c0_g2_i14.p1  ORF type:complete len:200 (-),score=42.84 TRINITY_DN51_c0_g2_i14:375-974(-)